MLLSWLDRRLFVLGALILNAIVGLVIVLVPQIYADYGLVLFAIGAFVAGVTLWFFRDNLLFQARLALLITIGSYAGLVKVIDPSAAFSTLEIDTQTLEIGARMFGLTSLALLGAVGGLLAAGLGLSRQPGYAWKGIATGIGTPLPQLWVATGLVLLTGYLSARSFGPTVFEVVYASGEGEGQLLGNLQAIGVISLVVAAVAGSRLNKRWVTPLLIFLGVYFFGWGILVRGGRLEAVSGLFALIVAVPAAHGRVVRLRAYHYLGLLVLALFLEAWGSLRSTLAYADATGETVIEGYKRLADSGIYHAGTISSMATTFSNTLHMIDHNIINFEYGKTYFDYLLRSPPEFMYPDRPVDLAWMFQDHGYAAIGGFFELAEAYLNFGILGCLAIPFLISFLMGICYRKALMGKFLWFMILVALLAFFFRGAWYQTFAYYKGALTGLVMFLLFVSVKDLFSRPRIKESQPSHAQTQTL